MQIDISTRHGQINAATKEKIIAKLEKLSRFQERLTAVSVIIDRSGDDSQVEIKASIERTPDFVSHARSSTVIGAVDGALQKMQEQMRRHKEKLVEHKSTGRRTEVPPIDEQRERE